MDLDEDEDTQEAINASLHDMSVNEKVIFVKFLSVTYNSET